MATDPAVPGRLALPARAAAVITRPGETVLLERDGREHPLGPAAEWCAVDARRGIVWLRTADGTLSGLDLWVAGPPQPLTGPVPGNAPIWIFDGAEHVPPIDPVGDDLGLQVGLEAAPTLAVRTVCEGDAATYCYVDGDPAKGLEPELVRRRARLEALRFFPGATTWLSARAARPSLPAPPPLPALPRLKVPKAACEADPEQCGTGARVRGTAYAWVVMANSRGDFFHADRVLMEPGNGRIRHPDDPTRVRRADEPLDEFTLGRFDVAPDGGAWLTTDFLIDAAAGRSQPHRGRVCGWWQPPPIAW